MSSSPRPSVVTWGHFGHLTFWSDSPGAEPVVIGAPVQVKMLATSITSLGHLAERVSYPH
jgi:hypothetical protein